MLWVCLFWVVCNARNRFVLFTVVKSASVHLRIIHCFFNYPIASFGGFLTSIIPIVFRGECDVTKVRSQSYDATSFYF